MSRVESLSKARDSLSVKFLEFTRINSSPKGKTAVFFEGEDEKYYSIRINTIRPDLHWSGIICGGKTNVILMRKKIREHSDYAKSKCLFFVDSDFDDNSNICTYPDTYITPCYSIENLYTSISTFKLILNSEFGISENCDSSNCYENSIEFFEHCKSQYIDCIADFNYWIRSYRLLEKAGAVTGRLNLNNVEFKDLVKFDLKHCEARYSKNKEHELFPDLTETINIDKSLSKSHFLPLNKEMWFRGKQNLEFFRNYIALLKEDRCKKNNRVLFKDKGSVKLQLTKGNSLSELSQYADTPECLFSFLQNFAPPTKEH
ncbi:DUF4435 domain-containing protein [Janthinobacterium sp. B9-8]|uniref:DUF4435 domain-containing protein n=1 Tax=Janthinobacterium sp. B9-8 TaxID=1236179 RepID=UPI00061CF1F0|nr:DUF4435 domain-containing protein [Janthinobacterium sp. B9-8]AMC33763.1 hypothetical protein VN23_03685 [Janthinobacterium sp. B9-8]